MLYLILICFSILLGGCSATGLVDCEGSFLYNPDDFTAEEQEWIEESATRWNVWVGHTVLEVASGKRDACTIHDGKTTDPPKIGQIRHPTESITIDKEDLQKYKTEQYAADKYKRVFEGVIMHELGHGLGFSHRGDSSKALMAAAGAEDFTYIDLEQCIELGICNAK